MRSSSREADCPKVSLLAYRASLQKQRHYQKHYFLETTCVFPHLTLKHWNRLSGYSGWYGSWQTMVPNHQASSITERNLSSAGEKMFTKLQRGNLHSVYVVQVAALMYVNNNWFIRKEHLSSVFQTEGDTWEEEATWHQNKDFTSPTGAHKLTWMPVSTQRLIITLPQHEEVDHIWHVVIPVGEISFILMGK